MAESKKKLAVIQECIEQKDSVRLKKEILDGKFDDDTNFWELVTLLSDCLTGENFEQHQAFFDVCELCVYHIIQISTPSELLLAVLEQADSFSDNVKFQTCLQIIQIILLDLSNRQQFYFELSLETLSDCIRTLQLPKSHNWEGDEREAQVLDPDLEKINKHVSAYLEFLTPFVQQVGLGQEASYHGENFQRQRDCLVKCLLQILNHPIVYLDVTGSSQDHKGKVCSDTRLCVEKLMQLMTTMNPDLLEVISHYKKYNKRINRLKRKQIRKEKRKCRDSVDVSGEGDGLLEEEMSELSLSCLAYLIHSEGLATVRCPCLLIPQGRMEDNLPFILTLLQHHNTEVQRKGVHLLKTFVGMQTDITSLTCIDLDRPEYFRILDSIFNIMIHCSIRDIRQECVQLVPVFMSLFCPEARYRIFIKLFGTIKHSGAYGFCVQLFKTELDKVRVGDESLIQSSLFFNVGLHRVFNLITRLPEGAATDLVESSDRIISVLNLCRFLVLRDPPKVNQTGFWDFSPQVDKAFLCELQTGLDMSKAHYRMELGGLSDGARREPRDVDMSVSVAGFRLPHMDRDTKIQIFKQALNTLDLIASLLGRLNELISLQRNCDDSKTKKNIVDICSH